MLRLDLICSILASFGILTGCSDSTTAPELSAPKYVRYSGTVNQPAPGGTLVYKMSGVWTFDATGAFVSGVDTVTILDASVYGIPGTSTMTGKTRCAVISGKEAWAESEVLTTSSPQTTPVGTVSITHLSLAGGVASGGGGPRDFWYPTGNVCADKPAAMAAFPLQNGTLTFP